MKTAVGYAILLGVTLSSAALLAADLDEFRVKRQGVFEFTQPPQVSRRGDSVEIRFTSKAFCDVTVVIQRNDGRIVRHLACGVLGDRAPAPLVRGLLEQTIVWDGKDDQGRYLDHLDELSVRVSLGLKADYEKTLFWEPKKRVHQEVPPMQATPEGVYLYDGRVLDHVRLFDHQGNYARTVYPFPADKLAQAQGLHWRTLPQDGAQMPMKEGFHQATLLSSGTNAGFDAELGIGVDRHNNYHGSVWGNAASTLAVRGNRLALARLRLNRLGTDGSTGGLPLTGPETTFPYKSARNRRTLPEPVVPRSAAFSPDGRWLYLTGYVHPHGSTATKDIVLINEYYWLPVVARVDFAQGGQVEPFLGSADWDQSGTDNAHFVAPSSVAVDAAGRLYVSDYSNDRVQVFSDSGQYLKSISTPRPAQVTINERTQEICVFSWWLPVTVDPERMTKDARQDQAEAKAAFRSTLTVFKSLDDPRPTLTAALPLDKIPERTNGITFRAALDPWAEPPAVWLAAEWGRLDILSRDRIQRTNIKIYSLVGEKLVPLRDFNEDARASVVRTEAPEYFRQRLNVDPVTGMVYVSEGQAATGKSFRDLVRIDPQTGQCAVVKLPFDAEDMCFGPDGMAYLRTFYHVARYNPADWSEVPFDYGEEIEDLRTSSSRGATKTTAASVIRLPVKEAGLHHHGGMAVSPRGHLVVAVNNHGEEEVTRRDAYDAPLPGGGLPYTPPLYPGRPRWGELHIWDEHGQMLSEDAFPGIGKADGLGLDKDDNLFVLSTATRILDGVPYFNDMTETLMKVQPKQAKVISLSDRVDVPVSDAEKPARPPEVFNGNIGKSWVQGCQWFFGGLGFGGKNAGRAGGGCDCYNARFALDYLERSFAPDMAHCTMAVLDSSGNLIMRVGRYGNADSAGPDSRVPLGGDEVGLFYAPYVATQTDRRLVIADEGNARIVSVRLSYHAGQAVSLAGLPAGRAEP